MSMSLKVTVSSDKSLDGFSKEVERLFQVEVDDTPGSIYHPKRFGFLLNEVTVGCGIHPLRDKDRLLYDFLSTRPYDYAISVYVSGHTGDDREEHLRAAQYIFEQFKQTGQHDLLIVVDGGTLVDVYHKAEGDT
jgi:hypothetical protein